MGASKSNRKNSDKEDKPDVGHNFAEEINDTSADQHSKNVVDQKITSEISEDPGADDYKKHKEKYEPGKVLSDYDKFVKGIGEDQDKNGKEKENAHQDRDYEDGVNKIDNENGSQSNEVISVTENTGTVGILCSEKHMCNEEDQDGENNDRQNETGEVVIILNEEDAKIEHEDKQKGKCQNKDESNENNTDAENNITKAGSLEKSQNGTSKNETTDKTKNGSKCPQKRVTWCNTVRFKDENGTVSEEEPKSCNSCSSIIKKALAKRMKVVVFTRADKVALNDQDSPTENKEDDSTRDLYVCDSCDLALSKKSGK